MLEFLLSPEIWIAFFTLTALELVLGLKKKYGVTLEASDENSRQHLRSVSTLAAMLAAHGKPGT